MLRGDLVGGDALPFSLPPAQKLRLHRLRPNPSKHILRLMINGVIEAHCCRVWSQIRTAQDPESDAVPVKKSALPPTSQILMLSELQPKQGYIPDGDIERDLLNHAFSGPLNPKWFKSLVQLQFHRFGHTHERVVKTGKKSKQYTTFGLLGTGTLGLLRFPRQNPEGYVFPMLGGDANRGDRELSQAAFPIFNELCSELNLLPPTGKSVQWGDFQHLLCEGRKLCGSLCGEDEKRKYNGEGAGKNQQYLKNLSYLVRRETLEKLVGGAGALDKVLDLGGSEAGGGGNGSGGAVGSGDVVAQGGGGVGSGDVPVQNGGGVVPAPAGDDDSDSEAAATRDPLHLWKNVIKRITTLTNPDKVVVSGLPGTMGRGSPNGEYLRLPAATLKDHAVYQMKNRQGPPYITRSLRARLESYNLTWCAVPTAKFESEAVAVPAKEGPADSDGAWVMLRPVLTVAPAPAQRAMASSPRDKRHENRNIRRGRGYGSSTSSAAVPQPVNNTNNTPSTSSSTQPPKSSEPTEPNVHPTASFRLGSGGNERRFVQEARERMRTQLVEWLKKGKFKGEEAKRGEELLAALDGINWALVREDEGW